VRTALTRYADLLSLPKKVNLLFSLYSFFLKKITVTLMLFPGWLLQSALLALAAYASDSKEAERLRHLASPAGKVGLFSRLILSDFDVVFLT
jgi:NADPH-ferrihemoprotein reductase